MSSMRKIPVMSARPLATSSATTRNVLPRATPSAAPTSTLSTKTTTATTSPTKQLCSDSSSSIGSDHQSSLNKPHDNATASSTTTAPTHIGGISMSRSSSLSSRSSNLKASHQRTNASSKSDYHNESSVSSVVTNNGTKSLGVGEDLVKKIEVFATTTKKKQTNKLFPTFKLLHNYQNIENTSQLDDTKTS